jgi:hypothetical protein
VLLLLLLLPAATFVTAGDWEIRPPGPRPDLSNMREHPWDWLFTEPEVRTYAKDEKVSPSVSSHFGDAERRE